MFLYAIHDKKVGRYVDVFPVEHKPQGLRSFTSLVNRKGAMINEYPEDFDLYYICEVNMETGKVETDIAFPTFVIAGVSCVRSEDHE